MCRVVSTIGTEYIIAYHQCSGSLIRDGKSLVNSCIVPISRDMVITVCRGHTRVCVCVVMEMVTLTVMEMAMVTGMMRVGHGYHGKSTSRDESRCIGN